MSLYFGSGDLYACGQLVSRFYRIRNSCYLYRIADAVNVFDLSDGLMQRIHANYRFIISFNTGLIVLGVAGVLPPSTSALLHNISTLGIGLRSMRNLLP